ncbi:hypothetical protein T4C_12644 [Trichinella pseudospiralis]|uniref:Uncharacterized protein n=1 Tax=Trichinella pseudospiralis TaxID=6337 RepID=A0A0V1HIK8_TRIPS|nr:hypothetical protein T4C_12644 [Trichinella pseudospiralis]
MDAWIFWGTWLLRKVCRGLPLLLIGHSRPYNNNSDIQSTNIKDE